MLLLQVAYPRVCVPTAGVQFRSAAPRAPGPMVLLVPDDVVAESGILSLPNHRILKDGAGADSPVLLLFNISQANM